MNQAVQQGDMPVLAVEAAVPTDTGPVTVAVLKVFYDLLVERGQIPPHPSGNPFG
jgi:hypothetical protein